MKNKMQTLYYVFGMSVALIGAVAWLTQLHLESQANAKGIEKLQEESQDNRKAFEEIRDRLIRIEDQLKAHREEALDLQVDDDEGVAKEDRSFDTPVYADASNIQDCILRSKSSEICW